MRGAAQKGGDRVVDVHGRLFGCMRSMDATIGSVDGAAPIQSRGRSSSCGGRSSSPTVALGVVEGRMATIGRKVIGLRAQGARRGPLGTRLLARLVPHGFTKEERVWLWRRRRRRREESEAGVNRSGSVK